jgi:predicted aspartyl protease
MLAALGLMLCNITSAHSETIKLEQEGGVYKLPVRINDAVTLPFIVDSGAAEVSIPADVFLVLLRGKTVSKADDLGSSKFTQADGTSVSSERFLLHKMGLGDHVVTDVVANVIPVAGEPLLGQSFLGRLPSWDIR